MNQSRERFSLFLALHAGMRACRAIYAAERSQVVCNHRKRVCATTRLIDAPTQHERRPIVKQSGRVTIRIDVGFCLVILGGGIAIHRDAGQTVGLRLDQETDIDSAYVVTFYKESLVSCASPGI